MKKYLQASAILIALLCSNLVMFAQKPKTGCNDATIKAQALALKQQYLKQNMVVFQEAMVSMISMQPFPVAVKLQAGKMYHMIFVGSQEANRLSIEIFDGKDKKLDEKSVKGTPNYIVYSFIPPKTDVYLVMLTQKKGAKDLCGSFTVLMPGMKPRVAQETPSAEPAQESNTNQVPKQSSQPVNNNPRYRPNVIKKNTAQPAKQH